MEFIGLILTIAILAFLVWLILQIPMPAPFKNIILGVSVIGVVLYLLKHFAPAVHLGL